MWRPCDIIAPRLQFHAGCREDRGSDVTSLMVCETSRRSWCVFGRGGGVELSFSAFVIVLEGIRDARHCFRPEIS